jgi:flagellar protein FliO/FliZ
MLLVSSVVALPIDESQPLNLPEYQEPQFQEAPSIIWLLLRIGSSLLVIVLLSYGLIRIIGKRSQAFSGTWINILEQMPLGSNRGLFLTDVGGKILLLGVTDHSIVKLMEIEDETMLSEMRTNPNFSDGNKVWQWSDWRTRLRTGFFPIGNKPSEHRANRISRFHKVIEEQLKRIQDMTGDDRKE